MIYQSPEYNAYENCEHQTRYHTYDINTEWCPNCSNLGIVQPPRWPHIYLAQFKVDESKLKLHEWIKMPRRNQPSWMNQIRTQLPNHAGYAEMLRQMQIIKVGFTAQANPVDRINMMLSQADSSSSDKTISCFGVPLRPVIIYDNSKYWDEYRPAAIFISGNYDLEQVLHQRWASYRIDPEREFFRYCDEMGELGLKLV